MTATQAYKQISEPAGEMSDQLLLEQLPQVKYIARRIHERLPQHVLFDDLLHAGVVGLIDAMHKFNPDKKVRFASYAKFRIRGAILDSLREMDWSPRDLRRKARRLETTLQKLQTELGHSATEPEIALAMGMTLKEFQHLNRWKTDGRPISGKLFPGRPIRTPCFSAYRASGGSAWRMRLQNCRCASSKCSPSITSKSSP
jgi:RNA polymerase sigma factor (sigma-70 family)